MEKPANERRANYYFLAAWRVEYGIVCQFGGKQQSTTVLLILQIREKSEALFILSALQTGKESLG